MRSKTSHETIPTRFNGELASGDDWTHPHPVELLLDHVHRTRPILRATDNRLAHFHGRFQRFSADALESVGQAIVSCSRFIPS